MGKDAPDPPDPRQVAAAQAKANKDTAREQTRLNSMDVFSPYGSSQFYFDPRTNLPIAQVNELTPELQGVFDAQTGVQQGIADQTQGFLGGLPQAGSFSLDQIPGTDQIAQTSYEDQLALMRPDFEEQRETMEIRLAERGIPVGSSIWQEEMDRFERARNETLSGAARKARLDAGQEFQRLLGNQLTERNLPFQELSSLMGLQTRAPQIQNAPIPQSQISNTDVAGNIWNAYQAEVNQASAANSGLFGLASAIAPAAITALSDERTKENRKRADGEAILSKFRDMPVDHYDYKPGAQAVFNVPESRTGPMAQDYARQFGGDGQKIDLPDMIGNMLAALQALDSRTRRMAKA